MKNRPTKKTGFELEKEIFERVLLAHADSDTSGIYTLIDCFQAMSVRFRAAYSKETIHAMIDDAFKMVESYDAQEPRIGSVEVK
jgi:uncharacterized protein YjaG (DUF416 family)